MGVNTAMDYLLLVLVGFYEVLLLLDYLQTMEILRNPMYYEKNPIINWLGRDLTWTWFGLWMMGGVVVMLVCPWWFSLPFLLVGGTCEAYWVWHNHRIGIRIRGWK